jgi:outer membrane protein assembly factor BamB
MSSIQLVTLFLSLTAPGPKGGDVFSSADWPQWRGLNRDGISKETGLLKTWPKDGPKLLWTFEEAGLGYSNFSVVGNHLYTMGAQDTDNGDKEFVLAIDTTTGKEIWRRPIGVYYRNNWGGGPRSTPTVDGDRLYALGANGDLVCLERATGKPVWQKNFRTDFNGAVGGWGYCESVLIDGDHLIATPGGNDGAIVALNKKTGDVVWRATDVKDAAEYVSLVVLEVGGVRHYVTMFKSGTVAVRAKDGKRLWSDPLGGNGVAVIPTPIAEGNQVYVTSSYNGTSGLLKVTGGPDEFKVEKVYDSSRLLKNHHGGVVKVDAHLYGHSALERGFWVCLDLQTGKEKWRKESNAKESVDKGSISYADGSLYCLGERTGTCVKIAASPEGWNEEGRLVIPKQDTRRSASGGIWPHPVIARGKLFLRDQNYIFCYDVRAKE